MSTPTQTIQSLNSESNQSIDKSKNPIVEQQKADKYKVPPPKYSDAETAFRNQLIYELCLARDQRDRYHPELDNMTYVEYYESNRRKDLSYLIPKRNKQDVRIVTGLTREKDTSLLNALLNMNLDPDITAFDSDDMVVNELGDNMTDMVKKSRELEDYNRKRSLIYRELIAQGDVFVQELWTEDFRMMPLTDLNWDPNKDGISDFSIRERLQKLYEGASSRMVNGKKIYLGNIRQPFIEDQHFVAVLNVYPRATAEARYRNWERWANVPYILDTMTTFYDDGATYRDWNLVTLNDRDKVAEIMVYWKEKNRFMIMLNGVMMLPIDYPLTAVSPSGEIPIAQGKLEPISDFAYSKSQPSKTKIDQEVIDEVTKLMIEKTRQSFKPPMGNKGKKVYSSNIFLAGKITSDISDGELFPLIPQASLGVTQPEFSFYQMIKRSIEDKTTDPSFEGDTTGDSKTATETIELKKQQMMQLGLSLDGITNLERRMTWNRIQNILMHWTRKMDTGIDEVKQGIYDGYKSFGVGTTVDNGAPGVKLFRMTTKQYPDEETHLKEEEALSEKHGQPVRLIYLDPEMLREIKYKWFILINPSPKSNDKLTQLMFMQNLERAITLFGPQAINQEYAKQRFAIIINEDYNKFFTKMSVQQMMQMGGLTNPAVAGATGGKPQGNGGSKVSPLSAALSTS